ncbi:leucine-rich repeat protein soc-2 homolog [Diachasma alloeum]|uniref:leucine-rich repeat protein soc-2 homolog n=1 Tax=Diachasma alloeum TaxID=454923 RepID=UPI000738315B|nr:leucine-rich repeat protein soc-2 homolog [Diachasma alloeum]
MPWKCQLLIILASLTLFSLSPVAGNPLEDASSTSGPPERPQNDVRTKTKKTGTSNTSSPPPGDSETPATLMTPTSAIRSVTETTWECPNITQIGVECFCDFPHTLSCTGDRTALEIIGDHLRSSREGIISLLDVTVTGISTLPSRFLEGVALHGLVISTGELRRVNENAFTALVRPLQALGLPNNLLEAIPTAALMHLQGLERLDLSRNKLKTLESQSFKGQSSLTYLDLCDNLLSQLSPQAFVPLKVLRSLKMRGNRLSVSALSALRGLKHLEELDLSRNLLIGPLGPNLLPSMPRLRVLTLSENELGTVKQGALGGLRNLTYLSLSHNQIDVLEDHAFRHLSTLTRLDLASNQIVAVSSASLAHLDNLITLDLTHNFLPSLTSDLIIPFRNLQDLRLDDNDITMVDSEIPTSKLKLKRFSLSDNPLNCDCNILEFANWLSNSSLEEEDRSSAVCATPPALENGVLTQVSPGSLLCGEPTPPMMTKLPQPQVQVTLKEFRYDRRTGVNLVWRVESCTERYTCDNLIIYEVVGDSEIEIDSSPLHCESSLMRDPCHLPVAIPSSLDLQIGHKYRYCIVLFVSTATDELTLGLGCSDLLFLEESSPKWEEITRQKAALATPTTVAPLKERITGVHVNISDEGFLTVDVSLSTKNDLENLCEVSVVIFAEDSFLHRKKLNCSQPSVTVPGLVPGRYKVCASLLDPLGDETSGEIGGERSRCVEVQAFRENTEMIILGIAGVSCLVFVTVFFIGRSLLKKFRGPRIQTQCFMPAQEFEITHKAHYIQLLTTTKV